MLLPASSCHVLSFMVSASCLCPAFGWTTGYGVWLHAMTVTECWWAVWGCTSATHRPAPQGARSLNEGVRETWLSFLQWVSAWPMSTGSHIAPTPRMVRTDFLETGLTMISHRKCSWSGWFTQPMREGAPFPDTLHPSLGTSAPAALIWEQGMGRIHPAVCCVWGGRTENKIDLL